MGRMRYHAMRQRPLPEPTISELERFAKKFKIDASGCWVWLTDSVRSGYGRFNVDARSAQSHRLLRHLVFGDVESGKVVHHLCDNTLCVNPKHMEVMTQAENIRRAPTAMANINRAKVRCIRGHILGRDNLLANTGIYRKCKACHRIVSNNYYRKKRNNENLQTQIA